MRRVRLASVLTAIVLCSWLQGAWSQDVYRTEGRWLDDQARSYRLDALRGTSTVVTLAYGACRRIYSTSLRVLQHLQALADERTVQLNSVVVGLDPHAGRPARGALPALR